MLTHQKFDDIESNPLLAQGSPVTTPYNGLAYQSFNARADGVSILRSHSPNNTASSATLTDILTGQVPIITTSYTGSKVQYFDFGSTYLGCAVMTQASLGAAQPCTVQFNETTTSGKTVIETCSYKGTALNPALVLCTFYKLKSLKSVIVTPIQSVSTPLTTVEYLDDVFGSLYISS